MLLLLAAQYSTAIAWGLWSPCVIGYSFQVNASTEGQAYNKVWIFFAIFTPGYYQLCIILAESSHTPLLIFRHGYSLVVKKSFEARKGSMWDMGWDFIVVFLRGTGQGNGKRWERKTRKMAASYLYLRKPKVVKGSACL